MNKPRTSKLTRIFRVIRMIIHTFYGVLIASVVLPRVSATRRDLIISRWCKSLLQILNIRIVVSGIIPNRRVRNTMFVGNHISWIDIHALNSVRTVRFVAKSEIRDWPIFGWFAEKTNTLFTERTKRQDAGRMVEATADSLRNGDCICFFPEGTTTDGTELRVFKGSLLQAAIDAECQVWPFSVRYPGIDGKPNTEMAYWGDITLLQSIRMVLSQSAPVVELEFSAPILPHGHQRRGLTLLARQAIASKLNLAR